MKKTIIYISFLLVLSGSILSSCEDMFGDFLDKDPSNQLTEEEVFSLWSNTEQFHFDTYNFLRHGANRINDSWLDAATDLAQNANSSGGVRKSFNIGNYYSTTASSELQDTWEHYYRGIRKTNMILERIDGVPKGANLTEELYEANKKIYKAEARFFRAYFHWELYLRYGAVPFIEQVLDPEEDLSPFAVRPTHQELIGRILAELTRCEPDLIDKTAYTDDDKAGRIYKPVAAALKSRILLYMASDFYASKFREEGSSPYTWQTAVDSTKKFITIYGGQYELYGIGNGNKEQYRNAILTPFQNANPEVIFWRSDGLVSWSAISNDSPVGFGGNGGVCPSQNLVDMYDMENGLSPFAEYDATGAPVYDATGQPTAINPASGYNDNRPDLKRDPRFYSTVLYHGTLWSGYTLDITKGGSDNPVGNANATPTGYYIQKYIPEGILGNNRTGSARRNWIFIRYAEILLNYAEALNEISGPADEVFEALQPLRDRVGLTQSLKARNDLQSKTALRNFIRKERTIELAFEEHRFWDVRRWQVAEQAFARPVYGVDITIDTNQDPFYARKKVSNRVFEKKMYLYPIPETEYWKIGGENNPGW